MPQLNAIELKGNRIKEVFFLARLFWCKFNLDITYELDGNPKKLNVSLRFIEMERKIDHFSTINEIILEAPSEEVYLLEFGQIGSAEVKVSFSLNDDEYSFSTSLKDIFILCDKIPVISFAWPDVMRKEQSRLSERMKNNLDDELVVDQFYVKDISVDGLSFFYSGKLELDDDFEINDVQITIPLLKKEGDRFSTFNYMLKSSLTVVRQIPFKEKFVAFGCKFNLKNTSRFFLIRQYIKIRKKEEDFFEKNQYYPKVILPPILFDSESCRQITVDR